jgi:uncharacterized protein YegJ (DUF2314 family)
MTQQELVSRAYDRAKAEHLHTWKIAGQPFYLVKSRKSEPGAMHQVEVGYQGTVTNCTCQGWMYRQSCTHAAAVARRLQRTSSKAVAA